MKLAIDPGTKQTGVAWFSEEGELLGSVAFKAGSNDRKRREQKIIGEFFHWLDDTEHMEDMCTEVAVESFIDYADRQRYRAIRIVSMFAEYLVAKLENYFEGRDVPIKRICKGREKKHTAALCAKAAGVRPGATPDECDAVRIGDLAGYLKH